MNAQTTQTIYNIGGTSTVGSNGTNAGTGPTLVPNVDNTFSLTTSATSGNNTNTFINSSESVTGGTISSLLGRALTPSDTVTVSGTIDGFFLTDGTAADLSNNGVEFGLNLGTGFRSNTTDHFIFAIDDNNLRGGLSSGFAGGGNTAATTDVLFAVLESSIVDGIQLDAIYDVNGITLRVTNVDVVGDPPANNIIINEFFPNEGFEYFLSADDINALPDGNLGPVTPYDFVNQVGESYSFLSFQAAGDGVRDAVISDFSIDVTTAAAVPEPSSVAILSMCATGLLVRRRRK